MPERVPLTPSKLASIAVLTREMIDGNNAEAVMTQVLKEPVATSLDAASLSASAAVAETSPAGILNGVAALPASPAGQNPMALDLANLAEALAPVAGSGHMVIVAAPKQASHHVRSLGIHSSAV